MYLETAQSISADPATPADISLAVFDDARRGEFLILSKSKTSFVQAAGSCEPFHVEFYDDVETQERPKQCIRTLSAPELEHLLLRYLAGAPDWHSNHDWELQPAPKWWQFW
jgi:hypothetical protein